MQLLEKIFDKYIYVVDDSEVIRTVIANCLKEKGFTQLITCENGKDALTKIEKFQKVDMVITDFDMPEMNGEALVNALREKFGDEVLIIVLSAQGSKQKIVEMMRKADDYIIKDEIDLIKSDIFFAIEKCFMNYQLRKENERLLAELKERDKRMKMELETAQSLLAEFKELKNVQSSVFKIAYYNKMSNIIGGDFFTLRRIDKDRIGVLLGDISGHGIPAALLMLVFRNAVIESIENNPSPDKAMADLNTKLSSIFPETKYATVSYLVLDETKHSVLYTNEFQNPIVLLKSSGELLELDNGKYKLIGIYTKELLGEEPEFSVDEFVLEKGDKLFLFTDGIIEATSPESGEQYGIERIEEVMKKNYKQNMPTILKMVLQDFYNYTKQMVSDDVTIFGIELF
ncbi:fused response regulator/phosphatase [Thermospira aquatica]|uniref:Fused response regulator/phosphatase n=1 Tax=Thermospira aquatica TaxID=2828656 RepID=A0AAX3BDL7_9SPIR|nr:fused response regulator/phosphatase [Thermospira aquatica]URA10149.1 fused response regulator/phosphatase [Thermospira aquatica]